MISFLCRLLGRVFPMLFLIPEARRLGAISFTEVQGVGWQCSIRPPLNDVLRRGAINAWIGQGPSMGKALRSALVVAALQPTLTFLGDPRHAPKLGGEEFDS